MQSLVYTKSLVEYWHGQNIIFYGVQCWRWNQKFRSSLLTLYQKLTFSKFSPEVFWYSISLKSIFSFIKRLFLGVVLDYYILVSLQGSHYRFWFYGSFLCSRIEEKFGTMCTNPGTEKNTLLLMDTLWAGIAAASNIIDDMFCALPWNPSPAHLFSGRSFWPSCKASSVQ